MEVSKYRSGDEGVRSDCGRRSRGEKKGKMIVMDFGNELRDRRGRVRLQNIEGGMKR